MLPQRPSGAPPRQGAKPPGSPPPGQVRRPPGAPPGPPPGLPSGPPGSAAVASKPPPKGPPPSTASAKVIPARPPPSTPPEKAEAKVTPPAPAVETQKKAPPPPRVALPVLPPSSTEVKPSPRAPPGKPPGSPLRAAEGKRSVPGRTAPPGVTRGSPSAPARPPSGAPPGRPPSGTPPARSPSGSSPGTTVEAKSSTPARPSSGTPPGGPRGPPPRGPSPGLPPGASPGTPRSASAPRGPPRGPPPGRPPSIVPAATAAKEELLTTTGSSGITPGAAVGTAPTPPQGSPTNAVKAWVDSQQTEGRKVRDGVEAANPKAKAPRSPPPSPKAPPGIPAGMLPPKSPPPTEEIALAPRAKTAEDGGMEANSNAGAVSKAEVGYKAGVGDKAGVGNMAETGRKAEGEAAEGVEAKVAAEEGKEEADSENEAEVDTGSLKEPGEQRQLVEVKKSPPGDPGRRRPPTGTPPGRAPPIIAPSSARPTPPPDEELAKLTAKQNENDAKLREELERATAESDQGEPPPPPAGLPPPEGLSDDEREDDDEAEGQIVLVGENDDLAWGDERAKELEVVRRGRFTVRCIEGADVRKSTLSNKLATVDAYLRLTLGKHKRAPSKKSKVVKKSGMSPSFDSELLSFDIVEPQEVIVGGDVTLSVELWDDSAWADDLLSSVQLSVLRFMNPNAVPTAEWLPLETPSGRVKDRMKVQVEISFEPALLGMFVLILYEGKELGASDPAARPNPYVVASLGEMYQKRSRTVKGGGGTPFFREEEMVFWIDKENWTNDLRLQVRSEDIGTDGELGEASISVLHSMVTSPDKAAEQRLDLTLEGQPSGNLFVKTAFLPAGKLMLQCESGRQLRETSASGRMDPYVVFKAEGQAVSLSRKTKVDKDGGTDPRWDETIELDIVDQYSLSVECFNHDLLESDELIGTAQCSLLPVFKRGTMDIWIQLTTSAGPGPPKPAGEIHCTFSFVGPLGVAFPQHQQGIDSFDDSLRVNLRGYLQEADEDEQGVVAEGNVGDNTAVVHYQQRESLQRSTEFTDAEIAAAFKFLDLDANHHIGAAEIRHILICMGELITDEEVDMMISMVDTDGDGQVSYEEFHRLIIDPDPSRPDFSTEPPKSDAKEATIASQEMKDRETKRWLLEEFVKENEIRSPELEIAYKRFRNLAPSSGGIPAAQSCELDFNTWILVFNVEATGQYRKLFKLFDTTGTGTADSLQVDTERVDVREFFLGVANFVEWSLEQRTQFIFMLFDDDRSGFLSMDELVAVLKANHLSSGKAVAKKAQTIMRQADADGSGTLTLDEFMIVAKKFPNLLFPAKRKKEPAPTTVPLLVNA